MGGRRTFFCEGSPPTTPPVACRRVILVIPLGQVWPFALALPHPHTPQPRHKDRDCHPAGRWDLRGDGSSDHGCRQGRLVRHHVRGLDEPEPLPAPHRDLSGVQDPGASHDSRLELVVYGNAHSNDVWAVLVIIVLAGVVALSFPSAVVTSLAETAIITCPGLASCGCRSCRCCCRSSSPHWPQQTTLLNLLDQQQLYVIGYMLSVTFTFEGAGPFTPERLSSPMLGLVAAATACMAAILNVSGFYVIRVLSLTDQVTRI
jgi:hypothetical protein